MFFPQSLHWKLGCNGGGGGYWICSAVDLHLDWPWKVAAVSSKHHLSWHCWHHLDLCCDSSMLSISPPRPPTPAPPPPFYFEWWCFISINLSVSISGTLSSICVMICSPLICCGHGWITEGEKKVLGEWSVFGIQSLRQIKLRKQGKADSFGAAI